MESKIDAGGVRGRDGGAPCWAGALVAPVFLALAVWFLLGPDGIDLPAEEPSAIDPALLATTPRREILGDPPVILIDGFQRTCMECHRLFQPREDGTSLQLMQHRHIKLDHGINDRCRNCHHVEDRDRLVLHDGTVIGYSDVVTLCSKCHGPTFRDWQRGAHGRTNGYWDASRGEVRRLGCTECHDPHTPRVPALDPMRPLPGPRAPRMGPSHGGRLEATRARTGTLTGRTRTPTGASDDH